LLGTLLRSTELFIHIANMDTKDAGRRGGKITSKKKAAAARRNGKKGGRPTTMTVSADEFEKMRKCLHKQTYQDILKGHSWTICKDCGKPLAV
jgi:hypothetical protein